MTKRLKESEQRKSPHIIIELEIARKGSDGSIVFSHHPHASYRYAQEMANIPEIEDNHCNIYFQFIIVGNSSKIESQSVNEEENTERSPKPRRRSCIGTPPWSKSHATYNTF